MDALALIKAAFVAADLITDDFIFSGPLPELVGKIQLLALQSALIATLPNWKQVCPSGATSNSASFVGSL